MSENDEDEDEDEPLKVFIELSVDQVARAAAFYLARKGWHVTKIVFLNDAAANRLVTRCEVTPLEPESEEAEGG